MYIIGPVLFSLLTFFFRLPILLINPFIPLQLDYKSSIGLDTNTNQLTDHLHKRLRRLLHRLLTTANDRFSDSNTTKGRIGHQIGHYVCVWKRTVRHGSFRPVLFALSCQQRQKSGARACISFTYSRCLPRHCDHRSLRLTSPAPSFRTPSIVHPASLSRRLLTFHIRLIHAIAPTLFFESVPTLPTSTNPGPYMMHRRTDGLSW